MDIQNLYTPTIYLNDISQFLAGGGDPNHRDQFQDTLLHVCTKLQNGFEVVETLVKAGADVNLLNFLKQTPLHMAVIHRNHYVVSALINFGALVNIKDCSGNSVLHYAINVCASKDQDSNCFNFQCSHRHPDMNIIKILLEHKDIKVNLRNSQGCTPLLLAVKSKNLDIVKALIRKSALVNKHNHRLETPLHAALSFPNPNFEIACELLRCGASVTCKDRNYNTPLDLVFKREGDVESEEFAEKLMMLITLFSETIEFRITKSRFNEKLWNFHLKCYHEIIMMKGELLGEESLYNLVFRRMNDSTLGPLENKIVYDIFNVLNSQRYFIYFDFILNCTSIPAV